MDKLLIQSEGVEVQGWFIPPFQLLEHELLILVIAPELSEQMQLLLTGKEKVAGLTLWQPFQSADSLQDRGLKGWLTRKHRVGAQLREMDAPNGEELCQRYGVDPKLPVNRLAGNLRKLLAVEALLSHQTYILFDTQGMDPKGVGEMYGLLTHTIQDRGGAVELIFRNPYPEAPPSALVIHLRRVDRG